MFVIEVLVGNCECPDFEIKLVLVCCGGEFTRPVPRYGGGGSTLQNPNYPRTFQQSGDYPRRENCIPESANQFD